MKKYRIYVDSDNNRRVVESEAKSEAKQLELRDDSFYFDMEERLKEIINITNDPELSTNDKIASIVFFLLREPIPPYGSF